MDNQTIIVIGASAGGIEAVTNLLLQLPQDLNAAIFIVIHIAPQSSGKLAEIFNSKCALNVVTARVGDVIKNGNVYVAPPDYHLIIENNVIHLSHGPKENRSRPAIDPLFRSAAKYYCPRVIGIILTGNLGDGISGLNLIKQCNGIAIVQNPEDAQFPDLPKNTIAAMDVDYILDIKKMGGIINQLVNDFAGSTDETNKLNKVNNSFKIYPEETMNENAGKLFTCPDCNGPLAEVKDDKILRFKCTVGHSYTAINLLSKLSEEVESALFSALRLLEERANMLDRMIKENIYSAPNNGLVLKAHAEESRNNARILREILLLREGGYKG